jgi:mannose-6-phosphate isomerase-like protein (cupin superfamily)
MADLQVVDFTEAEWGTEYTAPFCEVEGDFQAKPADLHDYSLWALTARLSTGTTVRWTAGHGDEVVAVLSGSLEVDGVTVPTLGTVIVESGTEISVRAVEDTEVIHYGPNDPNPPTEGFFGAAKARQDGEPGVHLQSEMGRENRSMVFADEKLDSMFHADSTCPTCRATLLRVIARGPMTFPSHLHSQDELIYVRDGGFKVGPLEARPGMLLAVPAGRRYGIRSEGPFDFLNYRRDVSDIVTTPGSDPTLEVAEGRGYVPSPVLG